MNNRFFRKRNKGFSLVEVLVAVAILGIVAAPLLRSFIIAARMDANTEVTGCAQAIAENAIELAKGSESYEKCDADLAQISYGDISKTISGAKESKDEKAVYTFEAEGTDKLTYFVTVTTSPKYEFEYDKADFLDVFKDSTIIAPELISYDGSIEMLMSSCGIEWNNVHKYEVVSETEADGTGSTTLGGELGVTPQDKLTYHTYAQLFDGGTVEFSSVSKAINIDLNKNSDGKWEATISMRYTLTGFETCIRDDCAPLTVNPSETEESESAEETSAVDDESTTPAVTKKRVVFKGDVILDIGTFEAETVEITPSESASEEIPSGIAETSASSESEEPDSSSVDSPMVSGIEDIKIVSDTSKFYIMYPGQWKMKKNGAGIGTSIKVNNKSSEEVEVYLVEQKEKDADGKEVVSTVTNELSATSDGGKIVVYVPYKVEEDGSMSAITSVSGALESDSAIVQQKSIKENLLDKDDKNDTMLPLFGINVEVRKDNETGKVLAVMEN